MRFRDLPRVSGLHDWKAGGYLGSMVSLLADAGSHLSSLCSTERA